MSHLLVHSSEPDHEYCVLEVTPEPADWNCVSFAVHTVLAGGELQRVYTDDRSNDETMSVADGDVVLVPRDYHPVVAPHGYDLYYLNVMAGPKRTWVFKNDPVPEWIVA